MKAMDKTPGIISDRSENALNNLNSETLNVIDALLMMKTKAMSGRQKALKVLFWPKKMSTYFTEYYCSRM